MTRERDDRLPSSPGRASTRAINDRAAAGSRQEPPGGSSGTSTSIWATIQASCASLGRFFNSLLEQGLAIMAAAEETRSPVILQASRGARAYAGDLILSRMIDGFVAAHPDIPVCM